MQKFFFSEKIILIVPILIFNFISFCSVLFLLLSRIGIGSDGLGGKSLCGPILSLPGHPVYCVSRPLPDFRRVIRIQNAPEDFVPGTMPLRLKTVVEEMPLNFLYRVQCP